MQNEDEDIQPMFEDAVRRLRDKYAEHQFNKIQRKLLSGESLSDEEKQEYRLLQHKKNI